VLGRRWNSDAWSASFLGGLEGTEGEGLLGETGENGECKIVTSVGTAWERRREKTGG